MDNVGVKEESPSVERRDLGERVRSGVRWKLASNVIVQVARAFTTILIARLLTPADFGLAALVLVFSGLAAIATDLSMGSALIQRPSISEKDRSTAFWTTVGVGALLTLLCFGASWPLAEFYGEPAVQPLLAVYSVTFLINGLSATQATLLTRGLAFRSLELRVIAATLISAPVGIAAALAGAGAWALILQALAYSASSLALLWVASPWRPHLVYSRESLRDLGGFGLKVLGSRLAWFANNTTDTILIGRFLGPASVGAYAIAFNIMLFPLSRLVTPLSNVIFPAFSRLQDDLSALAATWMRAAALIATVVAPAMLGLMVVAPEFVSVVLGDRWVDTVPVLQALAWVGLLLSIRSIGSGSVLLATNRSGTMLRLTLVTYAANVVAFAAGLSWGIVGVAIAYAITTTLMTPVYTVIVARAVDGSVREYARQVLPPLGLAGIMALCVLVSSVWLRDWIPQDGLRLAVLVGIGAVTYAALCYRFLPTLVRELRRLLPSSKPPAVRAL